MADDFTFTHTGRTPTAKFAWGGCGSSIRVLRATFSEVGSPNGRSLSAVPGFTETTHEPVAGAPGIAARGVR